VPENWLIVPEGNAKTTSLAGLAVYLLEFRPQASIPWAASSRDQAEIGYRQAEGFVFGRRGCGRSEVPGGLPADQEPADGGRIQVFAADDGPDGIIPTDAFLDELHRHKNCGCTGRGAGSSRSAAARWRDLDGRRAGRSSRRRAS
jgi:hypothetical protein